MVSGSPLCYDAHYIHFFRVLANASVKCRNFTLGPLGKLRLC